MPTTLPVCNPVVLPITLIDAVPVNTLAGILPSMPSTSIVESSANTLPCMSVTNTLPASNSPASDVSKSVVLRYPTSSANSERNVGAPCSAA